MRDTATDWEKLARENAYWAVLTEDQFEGKVSKDAMESFLPAAFATLTAFKAKYSATFRILRHLLIVSLTLAAVSAAC